jgi:hypothetical protein
LKTAKARELQKSFLPDSVAIRRLSGRALMILQLDDLLWVVFFLAMETLEMDGISIWIKGLVAAIIGGAANAITVIVVDPINFNLAEGIGKVAQVATVGAILAAAAYLKQSPIPEEVK